MDDLPIDFSKVSENNKAEFLSKFELVPTRKLTYDLPLLIIYNPNSGKKVNLFNLIGARLKTANVPNVFWFSSL